jgi:hypothetical protein
MFPPLVFLFLAVIFFLADFATFHSRNTFLLANLGAVRTAGPPTEVPDAWKGFFFGVSSSFCGNVGVEEETVVVDCEKRRGNSVNTVAQTFTLSICQFN